MAVANTKGESIKTIVLLLSLILLCVLLLSLAVGAVTIPWARFSMALKEIFSAPAPTWGADAVIIWRLRLPRALLAAAVGAALATAGAVLQGLLRNGMADSYVLGVSSGASVGAAVAMLLGLNFRVFGLGAIAPAAFLGAQIGRASWRGRVYIKVVAG